MINLCTASFNLLNEVEAAITRREFRIVKLSLPPGLPDFFLLCKRRWPLPGYRAACGRDRGTCGPYNYQVTCASNAACLLTDEIPSIMLHRLSWELAPWHWFRERLPRAPIVRELCMQGAWQALRSLYFQTGEPGFAAEVVPLVHRYLVYPGEISAG